MLGVHLLGVDRVLVVPHTRCAMAANTEQQLREQVSESSGQDASWQSFEVVDDQVAALHDDVRRSASHPLIPEAWPSVGSSTTSTPGSSSRTSERRPPDLHPTTTASPCLCRAAGPRWCDGKLPKQANPVQRFIQGVASLRPVASVFRHTFHHLDKALYRLLGQRTVSGILAGVPNIMLTTTGAKTGRLRTVRVIGVPVDGSVAVIGTRWGSETTPGWAYKPRSRSAGVDQARDGTRTSVTARRVAEGTEYVTILSDADRIYLGFPRYRGRITKRQVPVFVLEPQ